MFDQITQDDLILAFFPCIYFCENNELYFTGKHHNLKDLGTESVIKTIIQRARDRQYFYEKILKLCCVADTRGIRLIIENPYSYAHYLINNFPYKARLIDKNRTLRGDYFKKPTQYWFINCEPTNGQSYQAPKERHNIRSTKSSIKAGLCSEERSMISPDYARNFICDFILGKAQKMTQLNMFDFE